MKNITDLFQRSRASGLRRPLALLLLLTVGLAAHAAENVPVVEYSASSYHQWRPHTEYDMTNEGIYTQFNFCYYNDCGYDSWSDGIHIYVDDEFVGTLSNIAGDGKNTTAIIPESVSISSSTNGKVVAKTTAFEHDGDDYWVKVQVYVQNVGYGTGHKITVKTNWTPNRSKPEAHTFTFYANAKWRYMPARGTVSSVGLNKVRWHNTAAPYWRSQYVAIMKQNTARDRWIEPNDNNSVFSRTVVQENRSTLEEGFDCDFSVESNYRPTTFYPRYYLGVNSMDVTGMRFFDYCSPFSTPYFYRPKDVRCSFDQWSKAITVTWDVESYDDGASRAGRWMVFREQNGMASLAGTTANFNDRTFVDTNSSIRYDQEYTYSVYFLPEGWGEPGSAKRADDLMASTTASTPCAFDIDMEAEGLDSSIRLSWDAPAIQDSGSYQYVIYRSTGDGAFESIKKLDVTDKAQTHYEYEDQSIPDAGASYNYYVAIKVFDQTFESDKQVASVSGFSRATSIKASKGSYDNSVKVSWTATQIGSTTTYYELSRRVLNSRNAWELLHSTSGTASNYSFNDQTLGNGIFYEYRVVSYSLDNYNQRYGQSEISTNGFCSLTGTISGNINYGSGTAVEGVRVNLELASSGNSANVVQFYSLRCGGANGGIRWDVDQQQAKNRLAGKKWTMQMYVRPTSASLNPIIFEADGVRIGLNDYSDVDSTFQLVLNGVAVNGIRLHADQFTHLTAAYTGASMQFYTIDRNGTLNKATVSTSYSGFTDAATAIYFGASASGSEADGFVGYIDDVRFFAARALSEAEILRDYDHTLSGTESGLLAYWPLDEGAPNQRDAYDYSKTNSAPNENHGTIQPNGAIDFIVPEASQLSIYALTDATGNYIIRGIHYSGSGTNYIVRPQLGIHEFSPNTMTRFISATSNVYSGSSFTDTSSFPVSGVVYYQGTNYPVEDCLVKIDGTAASRDGELIKTGKDGRFTVDVPIGHHFVSVERDGHTFVLGGRFPEVDKYDFNSELSGLTFWDNTTVMVTGRVDGGAVEYAKPMGFASSVNNIGVAEIVLEADYMMNARQETTGSATQWQYGTEPRSFDDGNDRVVCSIAGGYGSTDAAKQITITTDARSGEFCAMLPPVLYTVKSVRVLSNPDIDFGQYAATIDASKASREYTDSLRNETSGAYEYFKYNSKFNLAYRSTPVLEVSDPDAAEGAYGAQTYTVFDNDGTSETVTLYKVDDSGNVTYTYQHPVYLQLEQYKLDFHGYELYENRDANAAVPSQKVPLQKVGINVANEFSVKNAFRQEDGTLAPVTPDGFSLDSLGRAQYVFQIGAPCLLESENYSRTLAISYSINGNRYSYPDMRGIVFGNIPTGSNFITAGPDVVNMILRDPPGTASSATWEMGTSHTTSYSYDGVNSAIQDWKVSTRFGVEMAVASGVPGCMVIIPESQKASAENEVTGCETWHHPNGWTTTTTAKQSISTSSEQQFDGPEADVFIGRSSNIIIGRAREVCPHRGDDGELHLDMQEVFTMGTKFDTEFNYTQNYVRATLIPNLIRTRNSLIQPMGTSLSNPGINYKYVSKVESTDPNFGCTGFYHSIPPEGLSSLPEAQRFAVDSVQWCNDQVARWEQILYNNEKAKVDAIEDRSQWLQKNYSFDAGSHVTISQTHSHSTSSGSGYEWEVTEKATLGFSVNIAGQGFSNNISIGYKRHNSSSLIEKQDSTFTTSFTLAEKQTNDALSVDVYNAPDKFGPIFVTRGGQTSGNWEPQQVTHYYRPGTEIMAQTQKIVVPRIYVDNPIVENVPVGESAMFKVTFANESETRGTTSVIMGMDNFSNPYGAEVRMGGGTLNQGIGDVLSYGSPVEQTIVVKQTNYDALDYRIAIILFDASQDTPNKIYPANADTAYIEAHFVPASSKAVLATSTPYINERVTGSRASFTISDYNLNLRNLRTVALRHKGVNDQEWTVDHVWNTLANCTTPEDSLQALTDAQIRYDIDMSDPRHWPEQTYLFQVTTMSVFGQQSEYFYGDEVTVVKDTTSPIVVGTPSPSNGVYNNGSEISVSFNEDIRGELLTEDDNISVIGRLNNATLTHDVAAAFSGGSGAASEAKLPLKGNAQSLNLWLRHKGEGGSLLRVGSFEISLDAQGRLTISANGQMATSEAALPANQWLFLSVVAATDGANTSITADAAYDDVTISLFDHSTITGTVSVVGIVEIGSNLKAEIHEVTVWDYARPFSVAVSERSKPKSQYTSHLIAYWPMNEGYGSVLYDKVAARNLAMLTGTTWALAGENYSLALAPAQIAAINLSNCATGSDDDYLLQLWFRVENTAANGANILWYNDGQTRLIVSGKDGHLGLLNSGAETAVTTSDIRDGQWHQFSMMVHKSTNANANLYLDGKSVAVVSSSRVANLAGQLRLGGGLTGNVDEVRILHDYYTSDVIISNIYQRSDSLNASVMGLRGYYPFEKTQLDQYGLEQVVPTLSDQGTASLGELILLQGEDLACTADQAPALKRSATVQNVDFDFYTTERTIFIKLNEQPATIQGCKLYVTVRDVRDNAGNTVDQVTWSFTVDDNSIDWVISSAEQIFTEYSTDEDRKLIAMIYNGGADEEAWTLEGLPAWLEADQTSGTLNAGDVYSVHLTVSEALPVGINQGQIYLVDSNGISHALTYSFTKLVNRPDWYVDQSRYSNTMNIIGQVVVDGVIQENPYSIIAAFDSNDVCVGTALPTNFSRYGTSYFMLTIFGNAKGSEPLRFRYYDANDGTISPSFRMTLAGVVQKPVFTPNAVLGAIGQPFIWAPDENIEQTTEINHGWQWISFYADPVDPSVASVFNIVDYTGEPVVTEVVQNDAYARREADGSWSGELTAVQIGLMYKVNASGISRLSIIGPAANDLRRPITITPMWNWLGANISSSMMLSTALADMDPEEGDVIKNRTRMAIFTDGGWIGTLQAITPGEGYFYRSFAAESKQFTYPSSATQVQSAPAKAPVMTAAGHFGEYDTARYDGTMTITAAIECEGHRLSNCELAAFDANGDLCGDKFTHDEDDRHLIYLVVHADHEQAIAFRVAITDAEGNVTEYQLSTTIPFEDGAALGTTAQPVVFDLTELGLRSIYNLPDDQGVYKTLDENRQVIIHRGHDTFTPDGRQIRR